MLESHMMKPKLSGKSRNKDIASKIECEQSPHSIHIFAPRRGEISQGYFFGLKES